MPEIISFTKVIEHERLTERLIALRAVVRSARADGPERPASPALAMAGSTMLRDIYRLVSREPHARTMPRLAPGEMPSIARLADMLRDAQLWLDLFKQAHRDHDGDYREEWLTIEAIEYQAEQLKTYPPA